MIKRYIQLFETWQWLNREEEESSEREYSTTVDEFLSWLVGPDWAEDWEWLPDVLMVDWEELEKDEAIGYHEKLKRSAAEEIEVSAQEESGQIDIDWQLDGVSYSTVAWEWPFNEEDGDLTQEETGAALRVFREIEQDPIGATMPDVIDWVQLSVREMGESPDSLSATGFKNWYLIQRSGAN